MRTLFYLMMIGLLVCLAPCLSAQAEIDSALDDIGANAQAEVDGIAAEASQIESALDAGAVDPDKAEERLEELRWRLGYLKTYYSPLDTDKAYKKLKKLRKRVSEVREKGNPKAKKALRALFGRDKSKRKTGNGSKDDKESGVVDPSNGDTNQGDKKATKRASSNQHVKKRAKSGKDKKGVTVDSATASLVNNNLFSDQLFENANVDFLELVTGSSEPTVIFHSVTFVGTEGIDLLYFGNSDLDLFDMTDFPPPGASDNTSLADAGAALAEAEADRLESMGDLGSSDRCANPDGMVSPIITNMFSFGSYGTDRGEGSIVFDQTHCRYYPALSGMGANSLGPVGVNTEAQFQSFLQQTGFNTLNQTQQQTIRNVWQDAVNRANAANQNL